MILPAARADLIEIGDFIAQDNPGRALSFLAEIEAKMHEAAERPESFPARGDVGAGLRAARHGRHLIFFLNTDEEVQIVRVLHGARDLPRIFG
ncbi:type II toxin-antitoxin system RelE/ParE family toxin [Paracoccus beibuensis]|uniref:type II toxin-antitoxin system RelE/ParE family toxin n=1 Tax=Paracoccus beibuensis TaxID=547602 RepID=UPI00223ED85E|nr:type II toxin-antitoxin system RelE/ParE family toxin [Paracoccus beibuensis]